MVGHPAPTTKIHTQRSAHTLWGRARQKPQQTTIIRPRQNRGKGSAGQPPPHVGGAALTVWPAGGWARPGHPQLRCFGLPLGARPCMKKRECALLLWLLSFPCPLPFCSFCVLVRSSPPLAVLFSFLSVFPRCVFFLSLCCGASLANYGLAPTKIEPWEKQADESPKGRKLFVQGTELVYTCEKRKITSYRVLLRQHALRADNLPHLPKRSRQHPRSQV